jgi:hypothetical protein
VGGVVGYSLGATISSISSTGAVTGDTSVGGVVGYTNGATISNCFHTTGDVTGTVSLTGGLLGGIEAGSMTNCYFNSAAVTSVAGTDVAGLVGGAIAGSITYCYTSPTSVSAGGGGANAVISLDFSGGAVIDNTNVFYNTTTAGAGSDGTALTDAEMMDPDNYTAAGWSTSTWNLSFSSGSAMPTLR